MKVGQASARAGQELMSKPKPLPRLTWDEQYLLCRAEEARTMAMKSVILNVRGS